MCKEMPVIPVNKAVDPKRIIEKMEGRGGGKADRSPPTDPHKKCCIISWVVGCRICVGGQFSVT
jgi:hypothetical protein